MMNLNEFADFIQRLADGSHGMTRDQIAGKLEEFGNDLLAAAKKVRDHAELPWQSPGGMGDRCRVQVVGPNGEVKDDKFHGYWN